MKLKRRLKGSERGADVRMVQRALNRWVGSSVWIPITSVYDQRTRDRMTAFQLSENVHPVDGSMEQTTLDKLAPFFDRYGRWRYRLFRVPAALPEIGPVFIGGKSVLEHDLTHATSGIPLYPAFDDAFHEGLTIIAPERLTVTRSSSSRPGLAFYAQGSSKLRYWFGHLDRTHSAGARFAKGTMLGRVAPNSIGGGPHVHVGVNVELLLGVGRELAHHTNYTHGAPTIGEQLRKAAWL